MGLSDGIVQNVWEESRLFLEFLPLVNQLSTSSTSKHIFGLLTVACFLGWDDSMTLMKLLLF